MVVQIVWLVPAGWIAHVFLHDVQDAHKQRQYKLLVGLVGVYIAIVEQVEQVEAS